MGKSLGKRSFSAIIGAAVLAMTVQANAVDITPYGAIRLGTFWSDTDSFNASGSKKTDNDFSLDNFGDSNVGFRAKEKDFAFVAEVGLYNPKAYSKGLEMRLLLGEWDFGSGKLRIGKAPSPYVYRTQQVWDSDGGMNGYGSLWDGRYSQIKVSLNNGFYFTMMQPRVGNTGNNTSNVSPNADVLAAYSQTGNAYATNYADYDTYMPKIVTGYEGKLDKWTYGGGVAYNLYSVKTVTTTGGTPVIAAAPNVNEDVHSYLVYFHGKVDLAPFEVSYNLFTGQNVGDLMSTATGNGTSNTLANPGSANGAYYDIVHGENSNTYGGWGQIGYTVNDKVKLYAAASYVHDDNSISHADARFASFINMQYQVSKNFKIVPEVDYIDDMKNTLGQKEPRYFAAGAKWEMTF